VNGVKRTAGFVGLLLAGCPVAAAAPVPSAAPATTVVLDVRTGDIVSVTPATRSAFERIPAPAGQAPSTNWSLSSR
jgi:hypothetical protein